MYNKGNVLNEEQIVSFLKDAVNRVENASEADIQAYNEIKKLFKKNVSLLRRNYVAALLIRQAAAGGNFRSSRYERSGRSERTERNDRFSRERSSGKYERSSSAPSFRERTPAPSYTERSSASERPERQERAPRVQIDPALATTIFIGIGRNRRVFPRDLVGLLVSVAGLDRERIGDIRVLANYSFIQLFTEDCEKAISALNGYDYRGRKLSVSYSRQRPEDGSDESDEAADVSADATIVNEGAAQAAAAAAVESASTEETIPSSVTNESRGVQMPENTEAAKLSEEQSAFAAQQAKSSSGETSSDNPFSETTDDGQVKSHFGSGAAY
ncbi:MAG: DbpA RNA binding domain-containing protein [Treponema sp.]|jgi:hypothetical protein|nr:DbpA RNA binding domain-containing protein [Treponema sp.]